MLFQKILSLTYTNSKFQGMIEALKTRGIREREEKEEKHEEEIQFLLRINEKRMNQLHSILYS